MGSIAGAPGEQVAFAVTLQAGGALIAGTQNDITFDAINTPIAAQANGRPNCTVNPEINKRATAFAFRPSGCRGADCTTVRALVLSTDNADPIPDGSVLYTCRVNISPTAATAEYPLPMSGVIFSDPHGARVPAEASAAVGSVKVPN